VTKLLNYETPAHSFTYKLISTRMQLLEFTFEAFSVYRPIHKDPFDASDLNSSYQESLSYKNRGGQGSYVATFATV